MVCAEKGAEAAPADAVITAAADELTVDAPALTFWTPDLVVALWLAERVLALQNSDTPSSDSVIVGPDDRSDTYLRFETLLI